MHICNTEELRCKEVINLCDGARLGYSGDFEFDSDCGKILSIIIDASNSIFNFNRNNRIKIPWDKIKCIGEDTILVNIQISECGCCDKNKKRWKQSNC